MSSSWASARRSCSRSRSASRTDTASSEPSRRGTSTIPARPTIPRTRTRSASLTTILRLDSIGRRGHVDRRMRILVTGGAGFIGANFVQHVLATHAEDEVVTFDLLTYAGNLANLDPVMRNPRHRFVRADVADPTAVTAALAGVDT